MYLLATDIVCLLFILSSVLQSAIGVNQRLISSFHSKTLINNVEISGDTVSLRLSLCFLNDLVLDLYWS